MMWIQMIILQETPAEEEVKTDNGQQDQSEQQPEKDSGEKAQTHTLNTFS